MDEELKYGLAVTGRAHPQRLLTNAAAKAGDTLVLTKPIGTGSSRPPRSRASSVPTPSRR